MSCSLTSLISPTLKQLEACLTLVDFSDMYARARAWKPTHDYEPTRKAAMAAFAKSWRRK
jgi:hypothetical protein